MKNGFRSFQLRGLFDNRKTPAITMLLHKEFSSSQDRFQLWHKKQRNRLAGSFLSGWQGITINSLLPLA